MDLPREGPNDVELVQGQAVSSNNVSPNAPTAPTTPSVSPATTQPLAEPRYGGFKHAFARNNPVPMFDNLRTVLILLVVLYNSILETVANTPEQDEKTAPIQFLILSNFVGLYRNFVIGLFFFVSGFGSMLSLNVYNKTIPLFVFHRSINAILLCLYAVAAPLLAHYVFGRRPKAYPGLGESYYASQKGRSTLLVGPACYIALLFCFDISYAVFRIFRNRVGVQKSRIRYLFWVSAAFVALAIWSIVAAGGYAPSIASIWPKYTVPIHDFHFPMQYIIGYLTGLFLPSIWAFYLPKTPSRRSIPTFLFRLLFLSATFTCLYLLSPDMKDQLQYANPKMPPSFTEHANLPKPVGINKPVIIYALWSTLVYFFMTNSFHLLFISEATESAVQGLKQNWGFVSRHSRSQAYNNIFFVIFFAKHVQWIGPVILKCIFVWVMSTLSGYTLAAVWEIAYRRTLLWARAQQPESFSKADVIKFVWNHINGTVDEKSVELFKTLLGDPKPGESVEMGTERNTPEGLEESFLLTGKIVIGAGINAIELTCEIKVDEIGEDSESPHDTIQVDDNEPEENIKARSHNIDNLRMVLIILVVFRYTIVQVIANAPDQTEANAPVQFAILRFFVNINRTTAVAMLYFVSGMWSTHTMEVQMGSRLGFLKIKAFRSVFLVIAYFNASRPIRYIYVGWPHRGSMVPLKDDAFILTDGSMFYVLLLFIFDCIHAFTAKNSNGPSTTSQSGFAIPLRRYLAVQYLYSGLSRVITAALVYTLTCVWKGDTSFFYFDPQFISLYALAYFSGIHFSSTMVYTFLSANVLDGKPVLTLFLRLMFSAYCVHLGSNIQAFMTLDISSKQGSGAECPKWLSTVSYGIFVPTIFFLLGPSILLLFFQKPMLMKSWGLFSRVTLVQPVLQTFLVIGLARHTGWIGNLMARCVFVGVSSVVCGWIVAVIPLVVWRLVVSGRSRRSRYMPLDSVVTA